MARFNNILLSLLALYVPFFNTFSTRTVLKYVNFDTLPIILLAYFIAFCIITNRRFFSGKLGNITKFMLFLFAAKVISGILAFDTDLAFSELLLELEFLVIFLIVNSLLIDNKSYEYIISGLLIGFLISCFIAVMQKLGVQQFYIFTKGELNINAGLIKENNTTLTRIWGPFGNSLGFSEYLATVGIALYSYFRWIKKNRLAAFGIIFLAIYCIILTVSRTALFATGFTLLILEFIYGRLTGKRAVLYVVSIVAILLIAFLLLSPAIEDTGNPLLQRLTNASQDLKEGRLNLWVKGFSAFQKNVFFGVGPGNLHMALSAEGFPMTSELISNFDGQHVENYFLTVLYTFGIVGFTFFMTIFFYLIKYSYRLFLLLNKKVQITAYGGAFFGAMITFTILNITIPALVSELSIKMMFIFMIVIINNSFLTYDNVTFFKSNYFLLRPFQRKKSVLQNNKYSPQTRT